MALMSRAAQALGDLEAAYCLLAKCSALVGPLRQQAPDPLGLVHQRLQVLAALAQGGGHQAAQRHALHYSSDAGRPRSAVRVFCVSDLHVDGGDGGTMRWLQRLSTSKFTSDVLIVAGDVADSAHAVVATLTELKRRFRRVFYTPGNHCLWLRGAEASTYGDSFAKMLMLRKMCDELGVDTTPAEVATGLFVVPLYSWYNSHFDTQDPRPGHLRFDKFCAWPVADSDVWQVMLKLNGPALGPLQQPCPPQPGAASPLASDQGARASTPQPPALVGHKRSAGDVVITASHFLPHPHLPYSHMVPELGKAMGCSELVLQLDQVQSDLHCYGHSHINTVTELGEGCSRRRYVQYALEAADHASNTQLMCVWDGGLCAQLVQAAD